MNPMDIKRIRLTLGMSQEKLARAVGVSFCTVNRWERNRTVPSPMAMKALKKLRDKAASNEQRNMMRLALRYPIEVRLGGSDSMDGMKFKTEDLSLGGLMFKSPARYKGTSAIKTGDSLDISLDLGPDTVVEASSEVMWVRQKDGARRYGLRFKEIMPEGKLQFMNTLLMKHPVL
jgi:DNA-binding XRE family transcriptional regulator